jgi:N-dimethylarginine dimethylaminohydrolase
MWKVRSESGVLNAVLIQESIEQFWERKFPFVGVESNSLYLARCPHADIHGGLEQWKLLPKMLEDEDVRVFEVSSILQKVLDGATSKERSKIIESVWAEMSAAPEPEELSLEHLLGGFPSKAYYDKKSDRVVLPDFQRVGWPYPRDSSFTTQIGTVICNMRRYSRTFEPRVVKLCYEYDSTLSENVEIIWDANNAKGVFTEPPCIEGGDTHILDDETIVVGIGQRTTHTGFTKMVMKMFKEDDDEEIKQIIAVKMPDFPAVDYMHLDVVINYLDKKRALVMPYFFDSELIKDIPPKKLLLRTLEALRFQSELDDRPMHPVIHPNDFKSAGSCELYEQCGNKPKLVGREMSLIDYLVREEKIDADGIIYVGGLSDKKNDVEHLMRALMEQARGASNIITLKPGLVIAFGRNHITNRELRKNGVKVMEWEDSYLDMLGGPHCSTSPLSRDPA